MLAGLSRLRSASDDDDSPKQLQPKKRKKLQHDRRCSVCVHMFSQSGLEQLNSSDGFRHRSRAECNSSKSSGCGMCEFILLATLKERNATWDSDDHLIFHNFQNVHSSRPLQGTRLRGIYGLAASFNSNPQDRILKICVFAEKGDPIADIVHRRPLRRNVGADASFSAARARIKNCMNPKSPHKHCQYSRDTVLPKRVLDVGRPGDTPPTIKVQVNETEVHAQYLALSYCWGKQPKAKPPIEPTLLKTETIEELTCGIKLEHLQKSIQDAIFVTRKLGFRYLWVDALCIIQNCKIDKDREISQMAAIYKNAAVTIAAASSQRATDGFLNKRTKPYIPDYGFSVPVQDGKTGTVYLTAGAYTPEHPLDKRGWALQEFMLSSRMLIFSNLELLWQCKESDLRGVTGTGIEYLQPVDSLPWAVFDGEPEPYFGSNDRDRVYLWKTIIQQYTDRSLTDEEDRLRAIQGITTELEALWEDVNIYGLWKQWFIQLLAWYKPTGEREKKRFLKRAPSWSWVSLNGIICYKWHLEVEDAILKSLTVSTVELTCRILRDVDIISVQDVDTNSVRDIDIDSVQDIDINSDIDTISERPDLVNSGVELVHGGLQDKDTDYLLLGKAKDDDNAEIGIALLVVEIRDRVYRRVGLAIFKKLAIWEHATFQDVILEPRLVK